MWAAVKGLILCVGYTVNWIVYVQLQFFPKLVEKFPSQRYLSITFCYPQHLLVYSQCIRHIPIKGRKGHWSKPISTVELFVVIRLKGYRRSLSARNRCGNRTEAARFEELNDSVAERERERERESIGSSPYGTVADLGSISGKCVQKRSIEGALSLAMRDRASENRMYN